MRPGHSPVYGWSHGSKPYHSYWPYPSSPQTPHSSPGLQVDQDFWSRVLISHSISKRNNYQLIFLGNQNFSSFSSCDLKLF